TANLQITAVISGANTVGLQKTGTGDLELDGLNTYTGPTLLSTGMVDVGSNFAFGNAAGGAANNSNVIAIAQSQTIYLRAVNGAESVSNPIDDQAATFLNIFGTNNLTFTGLVTLSTNNSAQTHTITVFEPGQVTNFTNTISGGIYELGTGQALTKGGQGTLEFSGAANYIGQTIINAD